MCRGVLRGGGYWGPAPPGSVNIRFPTPLGAVLTVQVLRKNVIPPWMDKLLRIPLNTGLPTPVFSYLFGFFLSCQVCFFSARLQPGVFLYLKIQVFYWCFSSYFWILRKESYESHDYHRTNLCNFRCKE